MKIKHYYKVATIAQLAERYSFDLEARVQILTWVQSFFSLFLAPISKCSDLKNLIYKKLKRIQGKKIIALMSRFEPGPPDCPMNVQTQSKMKPLEQLAIVYDQ